MFTLCLLFVVGVRWHILGASADESFSIEFVPARPVALILGAQVWGDRPSHMLEDRLAAGLVLYERGRCEQLLLSGAADEVEVMRAWLEQRGVPAEHMLLDNAGLRTFDSMVRAHTQLEAKPIIVVSQGFHLARALYLGRELGLDVVGVAAPANYDYPAVLHYKNAARERLAQVKAWLDLEVLATEAARPDEPILSSARERACL